MNVYFEEADFDALMPFGFHDRLAIAIFELRARLQARYEQIFPGHVQIVQKAIEEAESVAWCTPFPHLLLPDLAEAFVEQFVLGQTAVDRPRPPAFALAA
jgi:hypothetical protein